MQSFLFVFGLDTERGIVSISGPVLKTFPVKVTSQLMSWKRVTHSDFAVLPHAKAILDAGFANKNDLYFLAILERGSGMNSTRF